VTAHEMPLRTAKTWPHATLTEVTELLTDGTHYTPPDIGAGIPFLTVKDVSENGLDFFGCSKISSEDYLEAKRQNSAPAFGDILFSKDGTVGKVHLVQENQQFAVLSSLAILRPSKYIDGGYLAHFLRTPSTIEAASKKKTGSAIRRIVLRDLATLEIPLPPIEEQRRIAGILNKAEALLRQRKRAVELLERLAQAIFVQMFGSLSLNTQNWRTVSIEETCELIVDCVNRTAPLAESETPYKMIRTTNVRNGKVDLENVRYVSKEVFDRWNRRAIPTKGDVLLTREAPVGEAGKLVTNDNVFLGQRLMLYRPKRGAMTSDFLVWSFRDKYLTDQFDRMGSGSTVKHLPLPACRAFGLRLPPIERQNDFSRRLDMLASIVGSSSAQVTAFSDLFSSLQYRAFSAQL
jgi:type I restriction enzyme, S subunit